jgi:hypothetical protein
MVSKSNVRKVDRCSQDVICGLKKGDIDVRDILLSVKNEELIREENKVRDLDNGSLNLCSCRGKRALR